MKTISELIRDEVNRIDYIREYILKTKATTENKIPVNKNEEIIHNK